jgi:hypothetical protein
MIKISEDLTNFIKGLLKDSRPLRNDDQKLIAYVWDYQLKTNYNFEPSKISAKTFLTMLYQKRLLNPESIRRTRQKIQQNNPELRGSNYKERQVKGINFKKEL